MSAPSSQAKSEGTPAGSQNETKPVDDTFDWDLDDGREKEKKELKFQKIITTIRSAFLILLLEYGMPEEQRGLLYFLLIQFHEDLDGRLLVYSAIPALLMWYYPKLHPLLIYGATHGIDLFIRGDRETTKEMLISVVLSGVSVNGINILIDFRGTDKFLESIFGPASRWQAALLPILPGMFLRLINERPNSINGFVPENKEGFFMAIFVRACTAVLPEVVQWPIWVAYTAPSVEYPVMFVDWLVCTGFWIFTKTSPVGAYPLWLLVNQYRHANSWFRHYGGGPSEVLLRERRGTLWYIATSIVVQMIENEAGPLIMESDILTLHPKVWIPLALIFVFGTYLLKYGLLLRIYKYKHRPLQKGENIRLLRLRAQPCLPNSPIQCDMIHTNLRRPPQYIAISHRWDAIGASQEMILIDGGLFPVARSIHSLLTAKRSNLHPRYFWIDSICINQEDKLEKNRQVGMMRNIFEEAEKTLGWLGDDPGAKKAFSLVRRLNKTASPSAFSTLWCEPDSGWDEFEKLMSNEWFERVWIIQEIAVAKAQIIRYGNQEIEWNLLTDALARLLLFSLHEQVEPVNFIVRREVLSALIMEEVRSHVASVDLIKLKDTLKLALRFQATLPIDKIYALLGLVDERYVPLFHPKFGLSEYHENKRTVNSRMLLLKDVGTTLALFNDIIGTASGKVNSRRGRAILSLGAPSAVRYTRMLMRDWKMLLDKFEQGYAVDSDIGEDSIQPDYSGKTTAQLVYTYMARDLVKQGNALSFIRHAGLGLPRHEELKALPSWVPDWSTDVNVYLLPWRNCDELTGRDQMDELGTPPQPTPVFHDGGSNFLFIKGLEVGTVTHIVMLSQDIDANRGATREDVEEDFIRLSSSFETAFEIAQEHAKYSYKTEDSLSQAFYRTLTADPTDEDQFLVAAMRHWSRGVYPDCSVKFALWPEQGRGYWDKIENSDDPDEVKRHQSGIFQKYLFIRRIRSSANSKFAHLVRSDITSSFSQYHEKVVGREEEFRFSILNDKSLSPLVGFAPYVDYTIGRSFVVLDSGVMGIAPSGAKEGDVVVRIQTEGRIVWLILREEKYPESSATKETTRFDPGKAPQRTTAELPSYQRTFRLIGEAYIHNSDIEVVPSGDQEWFRLW